MKTENLSKNTDLLFSPILQTSAPLLQPCKFKMGSSSRITGSQFIRESGFMTIKNKPPVRLRFAQPNGSGGGTQCKCQVLEERQNYGEKCIPSASNACSTWLIREQCKMAVVNLFRYCFRRCKLRRHPRSNLIYHEIDRQSARNPRRNGFYFKNSRHRTTIRSSRGFYRRRAQFLPFGAHLKLDDNHAAG